MMDLVECWSDDGSGGVMVIWWSDGREVCICHSLGVRTPLWPTKGAFCVLTFLEWFSPLDVTIQCDNMGTIAWCGVSKV